MKYLLKYLKNSSPRVILLFFMLFCVSIVNFSCKSGQFEKTKTEKSRLSVTSELAAKPSIEDYITPYRNHINKDLSEVLATAPTTLDKSTGKWQTPIGNLLADVAFAYGNKAFEKQQNKKIDICLLNHGGIRSILPKGDVTTRTAFEIMPFENSLIVVGLKGSTVVEMVNHLLADEKPHPLSGLEIIIDKDKKIRSVTCQGKPIENDQIYYVGTSDYLSNGGDNMHFFAKGTANYDLNYKLRNILIDYFKDVTTINAPINDRIIVQ